MSSRPHAWIVEVGARRWHVDPTRPHDLAIALQFDAAQPTFFGAAAASSQTLTAGSFVGDVRRGGSCNCATYSLTPHCNGTHTECVGHITLERVSVAAIALPPLLPAVLVTVDPLEVQTGTSVDYPSTRVGDRVIDARQLQHASAEFDLRGCASMVIRSRPNTPAKRTRNYDVEAAPFFTLDAMRWMVSVGIEHLVVDLPSVDRADDGGRLAAHRIFWGMPMDARTAASATRGNATITEMAFVDNAIADGHYMLNLQVAPFASDAAPSRPLLYPRTPA